MSATRYSVDLDDIAFVLFDQFRMDEQLGGIPAYADLDRPTYEMMLEEAARIAVEVLHPINGPGDRKGCQLDGEGNVTTPEGFIAAWDTLAEGGWIGLTAAPEHGGAGFPLPFGISVGEILGGAATAFMMYPGLGAAAARVLVKFAPENVVPFAERMFTGVWGGTMCLTEAGAGTSVGDNRCRATPTDEEGVYLLEGEKIFISGGDHDLAENIVHLVLARTPDAPPGTKGISLFAVPKLRPGEDGLVPNDVATAGVFHKIGWRGIPSIALNLGDNADCVGWLVGEPHQGLKYMFQMMNEARLMVGMNRVASASVEYHEALEYPRTRPQGRRLGAKDPTLPQVPIIEHAEVRRMLLRHKAIVEGSLGLLTTVSMYADLEAHGADESTRRQAGLLVELLTPVAKSFPAERGFEANTLAIQVHGGYGYTTEYLPERWWRDQKLNSIHEGTTGIQGLDLLGRKVIMNRGAAMAAFHDEVYRGLERAAERSAAAAAASTPAACA